MSGDQHPDWEARYASVDRLWTGGPNQWLVDNASSWQPGNSLDVGCGEGEDVLWLASQGWQATGLDLSPTAIARMKDKAKAQGLISSVSGQARDVVAEGLPQGTWDLATSFFVHGGKDGSGPDLVALLGQMAARVNAEGRLMTTVHAVSPPWRPQHLRTFRAEELLDELRKAWTDPASAGTHINHWDVELCQDYWQEATGPDGATARKADAVLILRRTDG